MIGLSHMLLVAGLLHFALLSASALVPFVLDWRKGLAPLHPFMRKLIWVYGEFIVLVIIGFGTVTVTQYPALAAGSPLARAVCGFIAVFWMARLGIQLFLFDIRPFIRSRVMRLGNHLLTGVFTYFSFTYTLAAICPEALG